MSTFLDNLSISNYSHFELFELWETSLEELSLIYYNYLSLRKHQLAVLYKLLFSIKNCNRFEYQWLHIHKRLMILNQELWEQRKIINIIMYTMKCKHFINASELRKLNYNLIQELKLVESIVFEEDEDLENDPYAIATTTTGTFDINDGCAVANDDDDLFDIQLVQKYPSLTKRMMMLEKTLMCKYRFKG